MRIVADGGRHALLLGDPAGIDLKGGSEIGLSNEILVHRAQHGGGIGARWGCGVCGNDPGSKWQQPEGKVSHESKSYFDGVMALSRGSSQNNLLSSCSIAW
jgi:hypothetical protein